MQLRSIEIIAPNPLLEEIKNTLDSFEIQELWETGIGKTKTSLRFFTKADSTKQLLKIFDTRFSNVAGFRIIISAVEATVPAFDEEELPDERIGKKEQTSKFDRKRLLRIPHQELYNTVLQGATMSPNFVILFVLSAIVA